MRTYPVPIFVTSGVTMTVVSDFVPGQTVFVPDGTSINAAIFLG